jgi:hypothetical protein
MRRAGQASGLVLALGLAPGCTDPRGNDPNVPDLEPDGVAQNSANGAACPPALPTTCPHAPSYAKDIAPLVGRACVPCHSPGGVAFDRDLTTYRNLLRLETTDVVQVNACLMPPADAGPDAAMTLSDRRELLQWFVCGTPNN